jgi:hypothetical protein
MKATSYLTMSTAQVVGMVSTQAFHAWTALTFVTALIYSDFPNIVRSLLAVIALRVTVCSWYLVFFHLKPQALSYYIS